MALASTIETNSGAITPTGIIVALAPGSDPNAPVELWRAADSAGAPDVANAVMVFSGVVPPSGISFFDQLPSTAATYWYRSRINGGQYGPGPYTDWLNLGAPDRVAPDALAALIAGDSSQRSAAWEQANARIGPQGNILPNPGFEDGEAFWLFDTGTGTIITSSANANSGNKYLQLTSTTGVAAAVRACDDLGRSRYFEVNTNDVIQWGGYAYRVSGTANVRYVLELTDKDKLNPTLFNTSNQNTAAWLQVQAQTIVGSGKKYARFWAEIDATGTGVVARFDDGYMRIALGAIYDTPPPNSLYEIRFANAVPDPDTVDGIQSYIDFVATTNFLRLGQTPKLVEAAATSGGLIKITITTHGYATGDLVTIRGHLGVTAANGTWTITVVDANNFTLNGSTFSGSDTPNTGHCVKLQLAITAPSGAAKFYGGIESTSVIVRDANAKTVMNVSGTNRIFAIPVQPSVDSGATLTVDLSTGLTQQVRLTNNAAVLTLTNPTDGGRYRFYFQQDTTGSRAFPTIKGPNGEVVMFSADTAPTLTTTPGAMDLFELEYRVSPTTRFTCMTLQTNVLLPSPLVQGSIALTGVNAGGSPHTINLPASIAAGELLLIFMVIDSSATATTPAGWTLQNSGTFSAGTLSFYIFKKVASGAEGGTVNVTVSGAASSASQAYRISRWFGALAGVTDTGIGTGTSANPNSTSLTPGYTDRTLWLSVFGEKNQSTVNAYPTNYTTGTFQASGGAGGCGCGTARRALYAASEDPPQYTIAASQDWGVFTVAIQPPA